jgi:hypothetical protein
MQKILHKTHFIYVGLANLKFCSIDLKFGSQVYKVLTNSLCKIEKCIKSSYSTLFLDEKIQ